jgi:hypothetical protein
MKATALIIVPLGCLLYFLCRCDTEGVVWSLAGLVLGAAIFVTT